METTSRVYKITDTLRDRLKNQRARSKQKTNELITTAVTNQLPTLVKALTELGFSPEGPTRPIKFKMSEETLDALRLASQNTGLPATLLLKLSLSQHCPTTETPPRNAPKKATSRKAAPKASTNRKTKTSKKKNQDTA